MAFHNMPDLGPMALPQGPAFVAWALDKSKSAAETCRVEFDIPYGPDPFQQLDLWLSPARPEASLPILVFFHGGGWRHGHKELNGFNAPQILSFPAIYVTPNYRLAPAAKYPRPLEDVVNALAWVYRNIDKFGGDNRRIFVAGSSAGGHLAALATMRTDLLKRAGLPEDLIKACFTLGAPLDLRLDHCKPGGRRDKLIKLLLEHPDQDREASVTEYADQATIPLFLSWGSLDLPEVIEQNLDMVERLSRHGDCVFGYHQFDGFDHFETHMDCLDANNAWMKTVKAWMAATPPLQPRRQQQE